MSAEGQSGRTCFYHRQLGPLLKLGPFASILAMLLVSTTNLTVQTNPEGAAAVEP
jgi:hypothetical protein